MLLRSGQARATAVALRIPSTEKKVPTHVVERLKSAKKEEKGERKAVNELQNWISHHEITYLRVPTSYCSTHARPHYRKVMTSVTTNKDFRFGTSRYC